MSEGWVERPQVENNKIAEKQNILYIYTYKLLL